jgi:phosphomannomutase
VDDIKQKPLIRFGTDGWRAVIAEEFTFRNVERVAQAYAGYLHQQHDQTNIHVVIGYDRRFLSKEFASRVAEVLVGNNINIKLFPEAVPTPIVSWAVKESQAAGGVVITASHNPAYFNGFKIKASWGGSAFPEVTSAVESLIDKEATLRNDLTNELATSNNSQHMDQYIESYREKIASYIDLERLRHKKAKLVIDPIHGVGARWVENLLKDGSLEVETIRADRDPLFGGVNPEPIDQNLTPLKKRVLENKALLGLATDGDADRIGAVNEFGQTMTMHDVVPLILLHLIRHRQMNGGVIRTFSQSVLTKRIADAYNLPLYDTPIGFKYVADLMLRENILIGAEESGGIGVKGHLPERNPL